MKPSAAVDLLIDELGLLVIDGRCGQRYVVGAVGKLRDLGKETLDGLANARANHLPGSALLAVVPIRPGCLLPWLFVCDLAANDFAVERERLEYDVEAFLVLVRERQAAIEPIIVLAFALDHGIRAVRRLLRLISVRHGEPLSRCLRCPAWAGAKTRGLAPAGEEPQISEMAESVDRVLAR